MKTLMKIQAELKAPKGQYNSFGKYKYRSAEDILEAVKPLCHKHNSVLVISDELVNLGVRYYIKATVTLKTPDSEFSATAYAREDETKKGMDGSQITGTASSYARKYALNGLFCIDDTKDADTNQYAEQIKSKEWTDARDRLYDLIEMKGVPIEEVLKIAKVDAVEKLDIKRLEGAIAWLAQQ